MHLSPTGRRIGLVLVAAFALVVMPSTASASVTATELGSVDRAFVPLVPMPSGLFQITGTAPGSSVFDAVDIICDNSVDAYGPSLLVNELTVAGDDSFATAAVTDVINALSIATGVPVNLGFPPASPALNQSGDNLGADEMCNIRALPADGGPGFNYSADLSAFKPKPVGFGYAEEDTLNNDGNDIERQDYRVVANNTAGRWEMTSAGGSAGSGPGGQDAFDSPSPFYNNADATGSWGDDGLAGGQVYRGSNFTENVDSVIDEVAFLTADEGPPELGGGNLAAGAGILVDGDRGRLADEDHQLNSLEGGSHVDFERTVNPTTGDVTVVERQPVNRCRDTNAAFPSFFKCAGLFIVGADYTDTGIDLVRTYRTSNYGQTVSITDQWNNHTLDEILTLSLIYENDIEGEAAVGLMNGPISVQDPGVKDITPQNGAFWMILDGDEDEPENGDSADDGAVTYRTIPNAIVFLDEDEWQAKFTGKVIPVGGSFTVTQIWNQTDRLDDALAAAQAAAGVPAPVSASPPSSSSSSSSTSSTSSTAASTATGTTTTVLKEVQTVQPAATSGAGSPSATRSGSIGSAGGTAPVTQQSAASTATRTCTVPRLRGRSRLGAERALLRAGCAVGRVRTQRSRKYKTGRVVSQSRAAGRLVAAGTAVALRVSRGSR